MPKRRASRTFSEDTNRQKSSKRIRIEGEKNTWQAKSPVGDLIIHLVMFFVDFGSIFSLSICGYSCADKFLDFVESSRCHDAPRREDLGCGWTHWDLAVTLFGHPQGLETVGTLLLGEEDTSGAPMLNHILLFHPLQATMDKLLLTSTYGQTNLSNEIFDAMVSRDDGTDFRRQFWEIRGWNMMSHPAERLPQNCLNIWYERRCLEQISEMDCRVDLLSVVLLHGNFYLFRRILAHVMEDDSLAMHTERMCPMVVYRLLDGVVDCANDDLLEHMGLFLRGYDVIDLCLFFLYVVDPVRLEGIRELKVKTESTFSRKLLKKHMQENFLEWVLDRLAKYVMNDDALKNLAPTRMDLSRDAFVEEGNRMAMTLDGPRWVGDKVVKFNKMLGWLAARFPETHEEEDEES